MSLVFHTLTQYAQHLQTLVRPAGKPVSPPEAKVEAVRSILAAFESVEQAEAYCRTRKANETGYYDTWGNGLSVKLIRAALRAHGWHRSWEYVQPLTRQAKRATRSQILQAFRDNHRNYHDAGVSFGDCPTCRPMIRMHNYHITAQERLDENQKHRPNYQDNPGILYPRQLWRWLGRSLC
jgi:hypothetical protein